HVPHVRRLNDRSPLGFQEGANSLDEPVGIRDVREDVVRMNQVGLLAVMSQTRREVLCEKSVEGRNPSVPLGDASNVASGLDSKDGHAMLLVILQQIPVVTRHFYNEGI